MLEGLRRRAEAAGASRAWLITTDTNATTGHGWAAETLAQPVRVLIRGDSLNVGDD